MEDESCWPRMHYKPLLQQQTFDSISMTSSTQADSNSSHTFYSISMTSPRELLYYAYAPLFTCPFIYPKKPCCI